MSSKSTEKCGCSHPVATCFEIGAGENLKSVSQYFQIFETSSYCKGLFVSDEYIRVYDSWWLCRKTLCRWTVDGRTIYLSY